MILFSCENLLSLCFCLLRPEEPEVWVCFQSSKRLAIMYKLTEWCHCVASFGIIDSQNFHKRPYCLVRLYFFIKFFWFLCILWLLTMYSLMFEASGDLNSLENFPCWDVLAAASNDVIFQLDGCDRFINHQWLCRCYESSMEIRLELEKFWLNV